MAILYAAPWVVPVLGAPIENGGVAVEEGRILAAGPLSEIHARFPGCEEKQRCGALLPALVNAHIHLELSHLADIARPDAGRPMSDWILELIRKRTACTLKPSQKENHRLQVIADQRQSGVVLLADIGNEPSPITTGDSAFPQIQHFQEYLAPTQNAVAALETVIAGLPDSIAAAAHAPYSTAPAVIRLLKARARRLGTVFPIHAAESKDEIEFLQSSSGSFKELLLRLGAWDQTVFGDLSSPEGSVSYLHRLGVLDSKSLCVHCVHVGASEIRLLAETGAHVCLCPGSNRFLRVGSAPLEAMLRQGLLPAIGTDSLASNPVLDLWREMRLLREEHPGVEPATILAMATHGGAAALGSDGDYGSLAPGRKAVFLEVELEGLAGIKTGERLVDILTAGGRPQRIVWIDCSGNPSENG